MESRADSRRSSANHGWSGNGSWEYHQVTADEDDRDAPYAEVDGLARWTPWVDFESGAKVIDRLPGVYMMRTGDGRIVYTGMAGERAGTSGRRPMGMFGRLSRYTSGKAAASGFGEAALDRALADPRFVEHQLIALREEGPRRVTRWSQDAIAWFSVELRWTVCEDARSARRLEEHVVSVLRGHGVWNR